MTQRKYPFSAYDENLCLKMNLGLWLVMAFLMRPYVIIVLSLTNRQDRMGLINMFFPDRSGLALSALASLPAMLVIAAWIKRKPGAPPWAGKVWRRGRILLSASILLNVLIDVMALVTHKDRLSPTSPSVLLLVACGVLLYYLFTSVRVRDTFGDFPDEPGMARGDDKPTQ